MSSVCVRRVDKLKNKSLKKASRKDKAWLKEVRTSLFFLSFVSLLPKKLIIQLMISFCMFLQHLIDILQHSVFFS